MAHYTTYVPKNPDDVYGPSMSFTITGVTADFLTNADGSNVEIPAWLILLILAIVVFYHWR